MPVDMNQAKSLFLTVLEMPAHERAAFLETRCGDDLSLRQRVEAMLQADEASGELLPRPAAELLGGEDATAAFDSQAAPSGISGITHHDEEVLACLSPSSRPGSLGRLGHYEIQAIVGQGGFGTVFKAFDEKLHRVVAIKVLAPAFAANGAARKRFIREARTAAAVKNEHVVGIYAVEEEAQPPYLVMEMIDGISLQDKLDKHGPLGVKEILRIGLQMAEGLAAAHKQGLVHRDIKPANILLENGVERVKITDFGLARAVDDASVTQSGTVAGTPMYMSPEQAEGLPIDHRSDLFSLGTVLYTMCTGHSPFRASGTHAVLKRVIDAAPRPIREINDEIPDWLCAIIARLHAKKPEERFQTATEVAELLGQQLAHVQQPNLSARPARVAVPTRLGIDAPQSRRFIVGCYWVGAGLSLVWLGHSLATTSVWNLRTTLLVGIGFFGSLAFALVGLSAVAHRFARPKGHLRLGQAAIFCGVLAIACCVAAFWMYVLTFGPSHRPSPNGANLTIDGPEGVEAIVIRRGDAEVVRLDAASSGTVLQPGTYDFEVVGRPGYAVKEIRIESTVMGQSPLVKTLPPANHFALTVGDVAPAHIFITMGAVAQPDTTAWVPLFNGKDLAGWEQVGPAEWTVRDGLLRAEPMTGIGWLATTRDYTDFELKLEYRMAPSGNSGVFLRAWKGGQLDGGQFMEIQLIDDTAADTFGKDNGTGAIFKVVPPTPAARTIPNTWHKLAIKAQGRRVQVVHDGQQVVDANLDDHAAAFQRFPGLKKTTGRIGLQNFDSLVEFRNIEIKELPPPDAPFVVRAKDARAERKFATLAEAVAAAQAGDAIEIRGDGPFEIAPVSLDKALTLRAGKGYRPVFVHRTSGAFLLTTAPLVLEGLEFHSVGNKWKEGQYALIQANKAVLQIAHCRILVKGQLGAILAVASPLLEVQHSEVCNVESTALVWDPVDKGRVVINNCLTVGAPTVGLHQHGKPSADAEVGLTDNTFISAETLCNHRFYHDPVDSEKKNDFPSIQFKATGNVFHSRRRFVLVEHGDAGRPYRPGPLADWYRDHITWESRDNLLAINGDFLAISQFESGREPDCSLKSPKDWPTFWKSKMDVEIKAPLHFAGGDVLGRVKKDPLNFKPADFRLEKGSPGQGAGLDGKDLGADVDKVGPGAAYEKWKQAPEYQEWLKKTAEALTGM